MADPGAVRGDRPPLLAFTGGGTGGHIYPGLAVIEALRNRGFGGRIVWIGSSKELDRRIVEARGIEYFAIPSGKLRRSFSLENLADAFRVIAGYSAARRILSQLKPALLFSKGGYVSVPPCKAASSLGIPYVTHESDTSPGLATRLNAGAAERIFVSWPDTVGMLPESMRSRAEVAGNPVRPSLFEGSAARGRKLAGAPEGLPVVFFTGGSQGSKQVNDLVMAILPALEGKAFVIHQTGQDLFDPAQHKPLPGRYAPFAYAGDEMSDFLAASDIVAGRAGAGSIWEAASLGKPMVLIPLAGAGTRGDQVENARMAEAAGAAISLEGDKASPSALGEALLDWIDNPTRRAAAEAGCRSLTMIRGKNGNAESSADHIAGYILERIARDASVADAKPGGGSP
jgi:UDP-N-acetylglucosamine--N-acetylmuramyl-(pentapeptide) pyrophosphoryl-undecaprenol N-acetylglucosamine transferase